MSKSIPSSVRKIADQLAHSISTAVELTPEQRSQQYTVLMAHILREARESQERTQEEYLAIPEEDRRRIEAIYTGLTKAEHDHDGYVEEQ